MKIGDKVILTIYGIVTGSGLALYFYDKPNYIAAMFYSFLTGVFVMGLFVLRQDYINNKYH